MLNVTTCINSCVYSNFSLRYFMSSFTMERLYKSFSFINSSVQISQVELKIFRNSSTIFRRRHRTCSMKKPILKHFVIFTGKQLCWGLFFNQVAGHETCGLFFANIGKFVRRPIWRTLANGCIFGKCFVRTFFRSELSKRNYQWLAL